MRLYTIYKLCNNNMDSLKECQMNYSYENNVSIINVTGWHRAQEALNNLYAIKAFQSDIKRIYEEVPVIYRKDDSWKVASSKTNIRVYMGTLKDKLQGVVDVYESFGFDEAEIGIDVKMPKGDFADFSGNVKSLEYIINHCPILKSTDGEIKFSNVDVGSTWLTFMIVGVSATILAKNIATIVDKAIIIKSHWNQTKEQEEQLRTMGLANEVLETTVNSYKMLNNAYMDKALDELGEECKPYENGEERDKTKVTLEKMIDLLDKGMEIYSSINCPKEIQTLFPPLETESLIESNDIKLLATNEEDE